MTRKLGLSSDWISARFRDERARLELTHTEVAQICGVSRNAVAAWEKETSIPADALAKLFEHGFDPHYVITGLRYNNKAVKEEFPEYFPLSDSMPAPLSPDEWKMLRRYRSLSAMQKDQATAMLDVLAVGAAASGGPPSVVISNVKGGKIAGRDFIQGDRKTKK
jgi:DNA-binding XRE family transcriptional regulator